MANRLANCSSLARVRLPATAVNHVLSAPRRAPSPSAQSLGLPAPLYAPPRAGPRSPLPAIGALPQSAADIVWPTECLRMAPYRRPRR
jgi:hypothetical protein